MKKSWLYILVLFIISDTGPVISQVPQSVLHPDDVGKFMIVFPAYMNWIKCSIDLSDQLTLDSAAITMREFEDYCHKELGVVDWNLNDFLTKTNCIVDCYYYYTLNKILNEYDQVIKYNDRKNHKYNMALGQIKNTDDNRTDEQVLVDDVMGLLKHNPEDLKIVQSNYNALRIMFRQIDQSDFLAQQLLKVEN